jgi:hypothetical protein
MFNPFKKKTPTPTESKPVTLLGALGVTSPYRSQPEKAPVAVKNKFKKPYKLPPIGYAWIGFASCIMAGIAPDTIHRYFPNANATPAAFAIAFMFLAFFCGFQANQKWKH